MRLIPSPQAHCRLSSFRLHPTLAARPVLHRRGLIVRSSHGPDPDEEDPSQARQHPSFKPGQMFKVGDEEYRIERQLRARPFSIMWLAAPTNKQDSVHNDWQNFVALETFSAFYSGLLSINAKKNVAAMRYIYDLEAEQKKEKLCGPTLAGLQATQPHRSFALPVSKRIVKQTLLALDFIHTTMKRTHVVLTEPSGVNPHNLHVALVGSKDQLTADVQGYLNSNPPKMVYPSLLARIGLSEGSATMPKARPLPAFGLSPSMDNLEVRLGRCELATLEEDLQKAASAGDDSVSEEMHASFLLSAPEALRGSPRPFSPAVNIWAVGHLLFQCLTGEVVYTERVLPIGPEFPGGPGPEFPNWAELNSLCSPSVLERRLRSVPHVSKEMSDGDIRATCAFLSRCFGMDPARRPTAKQLLGDRWLQS